MLRLGFVVVIIAAMLATLGVVAPESRNNDSVSSPAFVAVSWIPQSDRIEICASKPGDLYRMIGESAGWNVGKHPGGCVVFPPSDALIDVNYAPQPGDRWCVVPQGRAYGWCSDPLPPNVTRYQTLLPIVAR